nr:HlyD family efflux transporter periplasmic adaptor subunit [uncultured Acetatifactor sp.]
MNENGKKKREWVKTAAIIFLSVMLVLTFFSNTIMNYSLPEVATQYVQSGTITAKIRGSGAVESGDPYNVEVKESRKVSQVAVKVGDEVEKDDVLMYLEDAESDELKEARDKLDEARHAYTDALLSVDITAADIQAANVGISEESYRNQITAAQNAVTAAENAVKAAQNEVTAAQRQVDELQRQYDAFDTQIAITPENNADVTAETKARDDAKTAWDNAAYVASVRKNELTAKKIEVSELEARVALTKQELETLMPSSDADNSGDTGTDDDQEGSGSTESEASSSAAESSETNSSESSEAMSVPSRSEDDDTTDSSGEDGLAMLSESGDNAQQIAELEKELEELNRQLQAASEAEINAQRAYDEASLEETRRKEEYDRAEQRLEEKKNSGNTDYIISNLKQQQSVIDGQKKQAQIVLAEKQAAVTDREKTLSDKQKDLEELASRIGKVSGLEAAQEAVDKAQKLVDELTEKSIDATIKAPVAGTVTTLNVVAGESTSPSDPVAVLQPAGKGYSLSFSVTNEQAKRLSVGDVADLVNAWRYDDVTVTLASIKPDTKEPGQKKLLTFDVSGNVTAGQTLDLSVGQKSANYDLIVPNSAIREDNNGKFILIVESKPGPLNTRYIATRVDVEVLASDDTQSAISAALYGYEFVITTSTKPVEAGKQVRLADG